MRGYRGNCMFDFNDSFGLHVTSLLKKISNEPTCTQGFLFIFQFSSSRNSPGGDVQIKSSSAAYSVSEWFSAAQSGHHKHRLARAPFLCQKQGGWKLCPQPARGAHAPPPNWSIFCEKYDWIFIVNMGANLLGSIWFCMGADNQQLADAGNRLDRESKKKKPSGKETNCVWKALHK